MRSQTAGLERGIVEEAALTLPDPLPEFVYKVTDRATYDASVAAGRFLGMPVDTRDGYIHFSTAAQLRDTLRLYFAGQGDLVLFAVRTSGAGAPFRWEPSRGGQLFPHLYANLAMGDIGTAAAITVSPDGAVDLPEWVR